MTLDAHLRICASPGNIVGGLFLSYCLLYMLQINFLVVISSYFSEVYCILI